MVVAISSIIIVNLINRMFNIDATLENNLIIYGLAIILPLISIIMGVISNKKLVYNSLLASRAKGQKKHRPDWSGV